MRNISDLLKKKERELESLQQEVEALRIALRLCAENEAEAASADLRPPGIPVGPEAGRAPQSMRQFP